MLNEFSPTIALPSARQAAAEQDGPLAWRVAIPLIAGTSAGLWILLGKAIAFFAA